MSLDLRRELNNINKHYERHQRQAGEAVVWYEFLSLSEGSVYDDVYDESPRGVTGLTYKAGVTIPTLFVSEEEDNNRAIDNGRQPIQNTDLVISMKAMIGAGITAPWEYQPRMKDIFLYDGRYYSVATYIVRGRLRGEVLVRISGKEVYVDQEMTNDVFSSSHPYLEDLPWPDTLPS